MRLYLDTEFNGFGGELISMALVATPQRYWYAVRELPKVIDPWVSGNVIPRLRWSQTFLSDDEFRFFLHDYLRHFDNPEIICDWNADAVHFCQWLAGETYETSLDYACRITILKTPHGQPVSENPHNALADAEALMRWNEARIQ